MPWLTPTSTPTGQFCRRLTIPDDPVFIQAVSGALLDLTRAYNWETPEAGGMSPDDAADMMQTMLLQYFDAVGCDVGERTYWEDEEAEDADSETEDYPFLEQVADWIVQAFLATSFSPAAAALHRTFIPRFRIAFRKQNWGAIFELFVDGIKMLEGDTYAPTAELPGVLELDVDVAQFAADNNLGGAPWDIKIVHSGRANPAAVPLFGVRNRSGGSYGIEVVRKKLSEDELGLTDVRIVAAGLEKTFDGGATWIPVGAVSGAPFTSVTATTLSPGSAATATISADVLELGIPRGGDGVDGTNGASAELRKTSTAIQWRQDDNTPTWADLVALSEITGPAGATGSPGLTGSPGADGADGADGDCADCETESPPPNPQAAIDPSGTRCGIATAVTKDLRRIWNQAYDDSDDFVGAYVSGTLTVLALVAAFTPGVNIAVAAAALLGAAVVGINTIASSGETSQFDNLVEEELRCALFCALDDSGEITASVISKWAANANAALTNSQKSAIVQAITDVPLQQWQFIAYSAPVVNSASCADCEQDCPEEWCYEFDFTLGSQGWSILQPEDRGVYNGSAFATTINLAGQLNNSAVLIHRVFTADLTTLAVTYDLSSTGNKSFIATDADFNPVLIDSAGLGDGTDLVASWIGTASVTNLLIQLAADSTFSTPVGSGVIKKIKLTGTGTNPFGIDNC